jgi:prepilin-type N-terminal cleavage/methylation domain-containing protein
MSDSCRRSNATAATGKRVAHGFTLLELLVVLALISLLTAMVAPNLQRTYTAIVSSGERAEVRRQLERLPLLARAAGAAIQVAPDAPAVLSDLLELPEGWTVAAVDPIRVEASGICHAARVRVHGRDTVEQVLLSAPACQVSDAP